MRYSSTPARRGSVGRGRDVAPSLTMHRLAALLDGAAAGGDEQNLDELERLIQQAAALFAASLSEQTRRTYARRWAAFEAWALSLRRTPLPAEPETLLLYLASLAQATPPAAVSTLYGTVAAVNRTHLEAGLPQPGHDPAVAVLLHGYARSTRRPVARKQVDALRLSQLRQVLDFLTDADARRTRDAALIALDDAGVSLDILVNLTWSDVTLDGPRATLASKTPGRRRTITIRDSSAVTPVAALTLWHHVAAPSGGHVFAATDRDGSLSSRKPHRSDLRQTITARRRSLAASTAQAAVDALLLADPWAARDRALLLLGFAGAFRRTEICDITWQDLTYKDEGVIVLLRRSKTDLAGRGRFVGIPYGRSWNTCAVRAMQAWRRQMETTMGDAFTERLPCFVPIQRAGGMLAQPLGEASISRILKDRTAAAGVEGNFGGRSLRAGFVSTAADLGIPVEVIAKHTRHATMDNVLRYMRVDDPLRRNAASMIGL
jgi:integrase